MLDTVSSFDVDIMRGMSFGIVPVRSRQPERLVEDLRAVFASDRDGPLKGRIRFVANARLGAVLVMTSQPSYLELARDWIARLDAQREGSEPDLHIYAVQNRPARELAKVLQAMFGDGGGDTDGLSGTLLSPKSGGAKIAASGGGTAGKAAARVAAWPWARWSPRPRAPERQARWAAWRRGEARTSASAGAAPPATATARAAASWPPGLR